jgi:AcrR family transcriptional regulator
MTAEMARKRASLPPSGDPQPKVEARRPRQRRNPEGVRKDILAAAWEEFVEKGLSGARVDEIAARTATSKRMIYYYFGDKEGLYLAVLEEAYRGVRAAERLIDPDMLGPVEAMARLAAVTFDYHAQNPGFVRLVMIENIHHARHLAQSKAIGSLNLSAIATIQSIYDRGLAQGLFRPGLDALDLHLSISAPSFYNVSNRASIHQVFRHDMGSPDAMAARRRSVVESILRFMLADPAALSGLTEIISNACAPAPESLPA